MLKSVRIKTKFVEPGFILAEDVYEGNVMMLKEGTVITERVLKILQNFDTVKVIKDEVDEIENTVDEEVVMNPLVELDENVKQRINEGISLMYEDLSSTESAVIATDLSSTLVEEVLSKDGVGINLEALKVSDEYTFKHSVDVAVMGITLAKYIGLSKDALTEIGTAGILHDIGKTKIPNEILNKNGKLTDAEFRIMQNHPVYGYQLLMDNPLISEQIRKGILHHHEKYNGTGYPSKLSGDTIPAYARLLSIVDVYDALVTERPYHKAYSQTDTIEIMYTMADSFDKKMFQAFFDCIVPYPAGCTIKLNTGEVCRVLETNKGYPLRPVIRILDTGEKVDLSTDFRYLSKIVTGKVDV